MLHLLPQPTQNTKQEHIILIPNVHYNDFCSQNRCTVIVIIHKIDVTPTSKEFFSKACILWPDGITQFSKSSCSCLKEQRIDVLYCSNGQCIIYTDSDNDLKILHLQCRHFLYGVAFVLFPCCKYIKYVLGPWQGHFRYCSAICLNCIQIPMQIYAHQSVRGLYEVCTFLCLPCVLIQALLEQLNKVQSMFIFRNIS